MATKKMDKSFDTGSGVLNITFVESGNSIEVDVKDFNKDITKYLTLHGLSQKLGDAGAGRSPADTEAHVIAVLDALKEGKRGVARAAGEGGAPRVTQLAEALARITGQEVADCVDKIAEMSDEQKKGLRAHPQIKTAIAEIKVEKLAAEKTEDDVPDLGGLFA